MKRWRLKHLESNVIKDATRRNTIKQRGQRKYIWMDNRCQAEIRRNKYQQTGNGENKSIYQEQRKRTKQLTQ